MEYKITITGRFPSMNEFIAKNRLNPKAGNNMKQKSQDEICWHLLQQFPRLRIDKPINLKYVFYESNKKRDLDNISGYFHKVFQDALVHSRIIMNDSWYYITGFSDEFYIDNKNPRIEVTIIEQER